jgi:hypothetical protein
MDTTVTGASGPDISYPFNSELAVVIAIFLAVISIPVVIWIFVSIWSVRVVYNVYEVTDYLQHRGTGIGKGNVAKRSVHLLGQSVAPAPG